MSQAFRKLTKAQNKEFERLNNEYWKIRKAKETPDVQDLMELYTKDLDLPLFIVRITAIQDEADNDNYKYTDDARKEISEESRTRMKRLLREHRHLDGEVVLPL